MTEKLGIYIHIPFCRSKCDYCDFYSLAGREDRMDQYQKALLAHIKETAPFAKGYQVDTVYFGGGTPSWYGAKRLSELLAAVRRRFLVARDVEVTVEANPDSVDRKMLLLLRRAGVNRLSLGVQSACDRELAAIHRPHNFAQVRAAVDAARGAKIKNLSLDLIYGLPGQDEASWRETLEKALALKPEHLSCYGLKVEEGTPLWTRVAQGEPLPDDDAQADCYLWTVERLGQAGFRQYEISNFARSGFQSRHNLKYWMGKPYIGLGPGAHSDFGGRRYSFKRDLDAYIDGVLGGDAIVEESELIPKRERGGEYLMLRMRTARGIEEWEYRREYYMNFEPIEQKLAEFEHQGWVARQDRRWHFTTKGFLLSNQLIGALLEAQEKASLSELMPKAKEEFGGGGRPEEKGPSPRA
ncbi:radical SAM family heme chaperone HemW [Pseudoflavonifractor phocaeensis]|uniref:radical SAM family heme chaperone HemW n=1 Tax=Pseudoflavonifractor phocaeensis TaxID=1870988 RepID=UPI00210D6024|nr:radical SAM family heme chaperone HemW [Pseudoflavonifractor phocaeensis]MCQ4865496.1 radical SAM family heme chaperone HemW [Pseudoflavonifractor phocaeensis]